MLYEVITQARTTTQLMQQATFIGWDFSNIWKIDEGNSYAYLNLLSAPTSLVVTNLTENQISLSWSSVANAIGYDIEVDGQVLDNGLNTTYEHTNLLAGSEHSYRTRTRNAQGTSTWSA